jgi:hypothetical protein
MEEVLLEQVELLQEEVEQEQLEGMDQVVVVFLQEVIQQELEEQVHQ